MTTFRAMGTNVWVYGGSADQVASWFEQVEDVCSRFRPDSELSHLNASSPGWSPVSPLLHTVLAAADEARMMTDGLVDPAIGAAVEAWGYDRSFEIVTDTEADPGPGALRDRGPWVTVRCGGVRGTRLDLGGVAKGWACDRAVDTGLATVVNAGGDLRSDHPDLRVEVLHPDGSTAATVTVGQGALATSSTSTAPLAGRGPDGESSGRPEDRGAGRVPGAIGHCDDRHRRRGRSGSQGDAALRCRLAGVGRGAELGARRSGGLVGRTVFATSGLELAA